MVSGSESKEAPNVIFKKTINNLIKLLQIHDDLHEIIAGGNM